MTPQAIIAVLDKYARRIEVGNGLVKWADVDGMANWGEKWRCQLDADNQPLWVAFAIGPGAWIERKAKQIHAPAQGLRFESVERDGESWAVDFAAGEHRYHYTVGPLVNRLEFAENGIWYAVARGEGAEEYVLYVIQREAGIDIDWPAFRMGYEQWYFGFVAGWCSGDAATRQGVDF